MRVYSYILRCFEFRFSTQNKVPRYRAAKLIKWLFIECVYENFTGGDVGKWPRHHIFWIMIHLTCNDVAPCLNFVHAIYQGTLKSAMINYCSNTSLPWHKQRSRIWGQSCSRPVTSTRQSLPISKLLQVITTKLQQYAATGSQHGSIQRFYCSVWRRPYKVCLAYAGWQLERKGADSDVDVTQIPSNWWELWRETAIMC